MGIFAGASTVSSGLVFAMDTANPMSVSSAGATRITNARQLVRNLINREQVINTDTNLYLNGQTYYTAVAIDYPESSLGGVLAGRQGLTPGFYNLSAGKTYDSSRALHMWVWNNDTNAWIADSYFSGYRLSGHCYDTYAGADAPGGYAAELVKFAANFNTINTAFPNCTYIITGSHRDSYRDSTVRAILYRLGLPGGTALDTDALGAPEWILVGNPSKPTANPLAWVYENNDANSAVAVVGLGNPSATNNYFTFDGSSNYIIMPNDTTFDSQTITMESWSYPTSVTQSGFLFEKGTVNTQYSNFYNSDGTFYFRTIGLSSQDLSIYGPTYITANAWNHIVCTYGAGTKSLYVNGVLVAQQTGITGTISTSTSGMSIGVYGGYSGARAYWFNGRIAVSKFYNIALTTAQVQQNFAAQRGRFGR
jgi:hypothetical protein